MIFLIIFLNINTFFNIILSHLLMHYKKMLNMIFQLLFIFYMVHK